MTITGTLGRMNSEGNNLAIECVKRQTDLHYCRLI